MRTLLAILLIFTLCNKSHAQQFEQYVEVLNKITDAQKEMKNLSNPGPEVCWDCVFKEKKLCSFADICSVLNSRRDFKNFYQKSDGTFIPNFTLYTYNDYINTCRHQFASSLNMMPEAMQKLAEIYKQKNKKFYEAIKKYKDQEAFVEISEAMLDSPAGNYSGYGFGDPQFLVKSLDAAEKKSGVTLKPQVRGAWLELMSTSMTSITELPEDLGDEGLLNLNNLVFAYPPKRTIDDVRATQNAYIKNLSRVEQIMEKAKTRILAVLEKKKTPQNAGEIESLKKRIETIKLNSAADPNHCKVPQAYYSPQLHQFTVCPNVSMMPDNALAFVIAHELGHSIDPCESTKDLIKMKLDPSVADNYPTLKYDAEKNPNFLPFNYRVPDKDKLSLYRVEAQDLSGLGANIDSKRISPDKFPFNNTLQCLAGKSSVNARRGSTDKKMGDLEAELKDVEDSGGAKSVRADNLRAQIETLKKSADQKTPERCQENGSQLQEAFSDWIASEAMAEDFKNEGDANRQVFEMAGFFHQYCHTETSPKTREALTSCFNAFPQRDSGASGEDPHPFVSRRMNRVLLIQPKIRAMLGCPDSEGTHCE